ncbi:hypothetical protein K458DRAFT_25982 [Lentithecium fluviatile CBS 122367]|uniref:DUF7707 domain-containing protein n=1 Tax=Lentithecium fluviatile CBS 122367 TaxID=1168545 RepID=A0A6G1J2H3_9PLEO|nr:hypothetical protein K458DRAFT_25982 [Lentithecium fluviatile CBS 122367]
MLYSSLLVAASAFASFATAQNGTIVGLPPTISACCTVAAGQINSTFKGEWCRANKNTCPEICGGQGQVAAKGNELTLQDSLEYTCKCKNGTEPDLANYEQTVPGQMCRFWYGLCVNASGEDAAQRFACEQTRNTECGNLTSKGEDPSASTSGAIASRTSSATDGSSSPTNSAGGSSSSSTPGAAALGFARDFGMPLLAGGLVAVFGIAL